MDSIAHILSSGTPPSLRAEPRAPPLRTPAPRSTTIRIPKSSHSTTRWIDRTRRAIRTACGRIPGPTRGAVANTSPKGDPRGPRILSSWEAHHRPRQPPTGSLETNTTRAAHFGKHRSLVEATLLTLRAREGLAASVPRAAPGQHLG